MCSYAGCRIRTEGGGGSGDYFVSSSSCSFSQRGSYHKLSQESRTRTSEEDIDNRPPLYSFSLFWNLCFYCTHSVTCLNREQFKYDNLQHPIYFNFYFRTRSIVIVIMVGRKARYSLNGWRTVP